ncbi:DUF2637 domain-containing protein [Lentzea sp. NEAU-D13]|uniref:DUF2637 domain-containing protein n=1 Tax=Lentzea alba TaxID=2714351 RepID=A0A7C9RV09_9PSEU|nr:DUF2637 domain-containing protein [Lentzea alba]NGY63407.1 DUF2637 domain-containing protein [Lentzea alba]
MNADAKRLERTGRIVASSTWVIAGVVMVYGVLTVTPWLVQEGIPEWSAWMLPPAVDAALVLALVGDRTLAQYGRTTGWGTTLRAVTGLVTLGLNVAPSALEKNVVGVALHAVGPVLLWVATEAAGAYQRAFTDLARELADHAGAPGASLVTGPGEDLAAAGEHQVQADLVAVPHQPGATVPRQFARWRTRTWWSAPARCWRPPAQRAARSAAPGWHGNWGSPRTRPARCSPKPGARAWRPSTSTPPRRWQHMPKPMPKDDAMGELVPFPGATPGPGSPAPAAEVEPAGTVLDGELLSTRRAPN